MIVRRWLLALWSLLLTAVVCIVVLAQLWIQQRSSNSRQRRSDLLSNQVAYLNDSIESLVKQYAEKLTVELSQRDVSDSGECLALMRLPIVDEVVVLSPSGQLHFPPELTNVPLARQGLVLEASQLIAEHTESTAPPTQTSIPGRLSIKQSASQALNQRQIPSNNYAIPELENFDSQLGAPGSKADSLLQTDNALSSGVSQQSKTTNKYEAGKADWITWYHSRGMILGFLWTQPDGHRCMALLPSARWVSDIVELLPESNPSQTANRPLLNRTWQQLVDIEGRVIYQWSDMPSDSWSAADLAHPDAEIPVVNPLEGWRLRAFASPELRAQIDGDSIAAPIWIAVAGVSLALVISGLFISINLNRQMRLASQRVSFVNQVSHELKTPLTNIRMYAEMLAASAESPSPNRERDREKITVIQSESQRLSRLISGVLHFAKSQREQTQLNFSTCVLDEITQDVLQSFAPRFERNGIDVKIHLAAASPRLLDRDAVEQILVNLLSNAEKYGASGGKICLRTQLAPDAATIEVQDFGPGVPVKLADKIFDPFVRGNDRLEAPAGTGIGLTIARDLARRHGGDCELMPSKSGARFRCKLLANPPTENRHGLLT
ncbi:MAG: hypothetical protein Aurels2KO_36100 [Aureliella sp.]